MMKVYYDVRTYGLAAVGVRVGVGVELVVAVVGGAVVGTGGAFCSFSFADDR